MGVLILASICFILYSLILFVAGKSSGIQSCIKALDEKNE